MTTDFATDQQIRRNDALRLLADGFAEPAVNAIITKEEFIETLSQCVMDFIDEEIPIVQEDDKLDLAFLLIDRLSLCKV